jgi:hypothetical protein
MQFAPAGIEHVLLEEIAQAAAPQVPPVVRRRVGTAWIAKNRLRVEKM